MIERSPEAARQLASRARRRVRGAEPPAPERDLGRQRAVVDAFFSAARGGDFEALLAVLDPDVVLRIDGGAALPVVSMTLQGAQAVAQQTGRGLRSILTRASTEVRPALVNGSVGAVTLVDGQPVNVMGFTLVQGKIVEIDAFADPDRLLTIAAVLLAE